MKIAIEILLDESSSRADAFFFIVG